VFTARYETNAYTVYIYSQALLQRIGLCGTPSITSDILWYQLIPRCYPYHYTPRL